MGEPILKASDVPTRLFPNNDQSVLKSIREVDGVSWDATCVSMGNPHCATFGNKDSQLNPVIISPKCEHREMFPTRTNTEFVQVFSKSHLKMREQHLPVAQRHVQWWLQQFLRGELEEIVPLIYPEATRRPLEIEWRAADNHVYMTGPAEAVFYGSAFLCCYGGPPETLEDDGMIILDILIVTWSL
ncbi:hypothetical protein SAY86_031106 [Trapa natans]|uniref:Uncharacterized protein n=1 Tax=Trapa natans TaxID=22666 RepID=A0AAN7M3Y8_TRANT|nr:hypothetical protein SAY86_031106 [Trapa natans]